MLSLLLVYDFVQYFCDFIAYNISGIVPLLVGEN